MDQGMLDQTGLEVATKTWNEWWNFYTEARYAAIFGTNDRHVTDISI